MPVLAYNTRILVDQFDFSGKTKGITLGLSKEAIEAPTLQAADRVLVPDQGGMGVLDLNGYFGGVGAGELEQELQARLDSEADCIVSALFDTRAAGNPAYVQPTTWQKQLTLDGADKLLTVKGAWEDFTQRGLCMADFYFTGASDGAVIDMGATGAAGGWAVIHVTVIAGTATNATFTVRSAAAVGFGTPTTHGTFTVSAVGAQRLTFAGAVGRYMRFACSSIGGATGIDVKAIFGVSGVTG